VSSTTESHFVFDRDPHDGGEVAKLLTPAQAAFEAYLGKHGYELAVDVCPYDSEEGGFLFAEQATDLVENFLAEHSEFKPHLEELFDHAAEIGQISNAFADEEDNDPDPGDFWEEQLISELEDGDPEAEWLRAQSEAEHGQTT
jgi:hypothetical protein